MLTYDKRNTVLYLFLFAALCLNIGLWLYSNKIYVKWGNVPPVPKINTLVMGFLGDNQFAFRASAIALQNYGSVGETQSLKDYNYETLGGWFNLLDRLDPKSNYVPYLAAYYYGAVQDPSMLGPVISYLEKVGMYEGQGRWRWLAQAAYLARHRMKDTDWAIRIARKLGSIYKPGEMPVWTLNMESMLTADMGDKQAAYLLMLEILKNEGPRMSASEYASNINLICETILTPLEAEKSPICQKPD